VALADIEKQLILDSIRDVKDFPKPGIIFKDITTLLNNPKAFGVLMDHLEACYKGKGIDFIAGAESRGFIFGTPLADRIGAGFVPIRKPGKLPYTTISEKYSLEYGFDEVEMHIDAFRGTEKPKVLFIDDLIATGGTANASINLIQKAGAGSVEACFIIELGFLKGTEKLDPACDVYSVLEI
jgi:adenine phosphoribosyltransferase